MYLLNTVEYHVLFRNDKFLSFIQFDGVQQFTSSPDTSRFNEMPAFNIDIDEQTNVEAPDLEVRADISQLYSGAPPEVIFKLLLFI